LLFYALTLLQARAAVNFFEEKNNLAESDSLFSFAFLCLKCHAAFLICHNCRAGRGFRRLTARVTRVRLPASSSP